LPCALASRRPEVEIGQRLAGTARWNSSLANATSSDGQAGEVLADQSAGSGQDFVQRRVQRRHRADVIEVEDQVARASTSRR
jgi:hypothetical protein